MLQLIESTETTFERSDIIARCQQTGAYLGKSRAQYYLIVPGQNTRHWKRSRFTSDTEAIEAANRLLK